MERINTQLQWISYLVLFMLFVACTESLKKADDIQKEISVAAQIASLKADGFQIFDYVDETTGDTVIMQQYYIAFLNSGANRSQSKTEADSLQVLHLEHLGRMYEAGYSDISGPMGEEGNLRGLTIYNVPTQAIADSLANLDPMVKAGRLEIDIKPWWAAKGYRLR